MLITSLQELESIIPNSKWDKIDLISPLFLRTENTFLRTYLGPALLALLNQEYATILDQDGTIIPTTVPEASASASEGSAPVPDASQSDKEHILLILQATQQVIVYRTFADNVNILSSSLNRGGGFNRAVASNYDDLSEKDRQALSKEFFLNSNQLLEQLIILLEEDAKSEQPKFREAWSKSPYYFYHQDLFFSTAEQMQFYYNLENKRTSYNIILPNIRSQQLLSVESHLGHTLTQSLLSIANGNATDLAQVLTNYEIKEGDYALVKEILEGFIIHVRHALAAYVRADLATKPSEEAHYHTQGDHLLNTGIRHILESADLMPKLILSSPLSRDYEQVYGIKYQAPATVPDASPSGFSPEGSASVPEASASAPNGTCPCPCASKSPWSSRTTSHILDLT